MSTIEKNAPHLLKTLQTYGRPTPTVGAVGGWNLAVGRTGELRGVFNSSAAAYGALATPRVAPRAAVVRVVRGPRVMFGAANGAELLWDAVANEFQRRQLRDAERREQEEREEQDEEAAMFAMRSAQAESVRVRTRVKQSTLIKLKKAGAVRIHGHSRRHGKTVAVASGRKPRRLRGRRV